VKSAAAATCYLSLDRACLLRTGAAGFCSCCRLLAAALGVSASLLAFNSCSAPAACTYACAGVKCCVATCGRMALVFASQLCRWMTIRAKARTLHLCAALPASAKTSACGREGRREAQHGGAGIGTVGRYAFPGLVLRHPYPAYLPGLSILLRMAADVGGRRSWPQTIRVNILPFSLTFGK